jgi:hypothetical protein
MCIPHMIMFFLEWQLLLHVLSWMIHVTPYLGELNNL